MTLFALSLDFGLSETVLFLVRIIATVGGAVVGWFVCDPLTRIVYRASAAKPTPGGLLLGTKMGGAATLALLIYFFLPLGSGGGGGFGFGPGAGGLPGKGPGDGSDKVASKDNAKTDKANKDTKDQSTDDAKTPQKRERVEIELIASDRNEPTYLIKGATDPIGINGLREYFEKNHGKIIVIPVLTERSPGLQRPNDALVRLKQLGREFKIDILQEKNLTLTPDP